MLPFSQCEDLLMLPLPPSDVPPSSSPLLIPPPSGVFPSSLFRILPSSCGTPSPPPSAPLIACFSSSTPLFPTLHDLFSLLSVPLLPVRSSSGRFPPPSGTEGGVHHGRMPPLRDRRGAVRSQTRTSPPLRDRRGGPPKGETPLRDRRATQHGIAFPCGSGGSREQLLALRASSRFAWTPVFVGSRSSGRFSGRFP